MTALFDVVAKDIAKRACLLPAVNPEQASARVEWAADMIRWAFKLLEQGRGEADILRLNEEQTLARLPASEFSEAAIETIAAESRRMCLYSLEAVKAFAIAD